jgi:hypothetical protein
MTASMVQWSEFPAAEVVDLERGPLNLVSTTEELLRRNRIEHTAVGIHRAGHVTPPIHRSWH